MGRSPALAVGIPGVGVVATAHDAEMAGQIGFLRICRRQRDTILELRHGVRLLTVMGLQHVGLAAVDQAGDGHGANTVGGRVVLELDLRQIFGRLAADHLTRLLGIEHAVVTGALETLRGRVVHQGAAHVGAKIAVSDDVAVRANTAGHALAHLDRHTGRIGVRVAERHRGVGLHRLGLAHRGFRVGQHSHAGCRLNRSLVTACGHCGADRADGSAHACYAGSGDFEKNATRYFFGHDASSGLL